MKSRINIYNEIQMKDIERCFTERDRVRLFGFFRALDEGIVLRAESFEVGFIWFN